MKLRQRDRCDRRICHGPRGRSRGIPWGVYGCTHLLVEQRCGDSTSASVRVTPRRRGRLVSFGNANVDAISAVLSRSAEGRRATRNWFDDNIVRRTDLAFCFPWAQLDVGFTDSSSDDVQSLEHQRRLNGVGVLRISADTCSAADLSAAVRWSRAGAVGSVSNPRMTVFPTLRATRRRRRSSARQLGQNDSHTGGLHELRGPVRTTYA